MSKKEIVCYLPTWDPKVIDKVDTNLCTIINIAFGDVDAYGNIIVPSNLENYKIFKTKLPKIKLVLALGGANEKAKKAFSEIAKLPSCRKTFAQNCFDVVEKHELDGIDIDWEFPEKNERGIFVALHKDLKEKLGSAYIVSTAVMPGNDKVNTNKIYDIAELAKAVDFIHLMTYDFHMDEEWDKNTGVYFNAPVRADSGDSVENGIKLFLDGGAPASKLTVGIPFYGRIYELANKYKTEPGAPFKVGFQQKSIAYTPAFRDYCSKIEDSSWTKKRDVTTCCPYMYSGNQWISYEDEISVTEKGKLANKYDLGGVMVWSMNQDDYDGTCSSCKWPLLRALNKACLDNEQPRPVVLNKPTKQPESWCSC